MKVGFSSCRPDVSSKGSDDELYVFSRQSVFGAGYGNQVSRRVRNQIFASLGVLKIRWTNRDWISKCLEPNPFGFAHCNLFAFAPQIFCGSKWLHRARSRHAAAQRSSRS
jgi:hypothetical protein